MAAEELSPEPGSTEDETLACCPTINVDWFAEYRKQSPIPPEELAFWFQDIMHQKNPVRRDINLAILFTGLRRNDAAETFISG